MNVITLCGRAGRDPEMRYFESGTVVANLSLAVNSTKRDEPPDWFNLEIWGKTAQVAGDYVRKGSQIAVSGRMTTQRWTDRTTGEEKSKPVVVVDRLTLLGSRQDQERVGGAVQQQAPVQQQTAPPVQYAPHPQVAPAPVPAPAPAQYAQQRPAPLPPNAREIPF